MISEDNLVVGTYYLGRTGNTFRLFRSYSPSEECFKRTTDGRLFRGCEFIEFREGQRMLDICPLEEDEE